MPVESNAFQRLIDRVLFPNVDGVEEESSRPWILLQTLLSQNAQARNYAHRLVLQHASDRPEDFKRGGACEVRLLALLDLWPHPEREALRAAVDRQTTGHCAGTWRNIGDGRESGNPVDGWSPCDRPIAASGYSTPPRPTGGTPSWGPPLSDSPQPPREQYARQYQVVEESSLASSNTRLQAAPSADARSPIALRNQQLHDSTATTVPMQFTRESRVGRMEIEGSTVTLERCSREVSSSLDAWIRRSIPQQNADVRQQQSLRSRSVPVSQEWHGSRQPQLVVDFGPSSSSGDDAKILDRTSGRRASTMSTVVESGRYAPERNDSRRLKAGDVRETNTDSSSDEKKKQKVAIDDARPWSRPRRYVKHSNDQDGRVSFDSHAHFIKPHGLLLERWYCIASLAQRHAAVEITKECRGLKDVHKSIVESVSWWKKCSARVVHQQIQCLRFCMAAAATVAIQAQCTAAKWQAVAHNTVQLRKWQTVHALMQTCDAALILRRFFQIVIWQWLRIGFQNWCHFNSVRKTTQFTACAKTQQFRSVCERVQVSGRASEIGRFIVALRQCAQERQSRHESAAITLVTWMQKRLQSQIYNAFIGLQRAARLRTISVRIGAEHLVRCIDKLRLLRTAAAMSSLHRTALRNLSAAEAASKSQAVRWAALHCMGQALRIWQRHHNRTRRLRLPFSRILRRTQNWAWHRLHLNSERKRCELRLGVICAARMERVHSDREICVEGLRFDYAAQVRAAHDRAVRSRQSELEARQFLMKTRLQRIAMCVWIRTIDRDRAIRRLAGLIRNHHCRLGFTSLKAHANQIVLSSSRAKVALMMRRSNICTRFFAKCAIKCDGVGMQLVLSSWHHVTGQIKHAESRQRLACWILAHVTGDALRRMGWLPWRKWHAQQSSALLALDHRAQLHRLQRDHEDVRVALRATRLQTEESLNDLGHQVREQEQISWTVAMEAEATRMMYCSHLWKTWASRRQQSFVRRISSCLRQAHAPTASTINVAARWRRCAGGVVSTTLIQIRAALCLAASSYVRARKNGLEKRIERQHSRNKLATLIRTAHAAHARRIVHEVVVGFNRLADARRRLHTFLRIFRSLELRAVMRRMHHWSRKQIIDTSLHERRGVTLTCDRLSGTRMMVTQLYAMIRCRKYYVFQKLRSERARRKPMQRREWSARRGMRHLEKMYWQSLTQTFEQWRQYALRSIVRNLRSNVKVSQSQQMCWVVQQRLRRSFRRWHSFSHGPQQICSVLDLLTKSKTKWAWHNMRFHSLRRGQEKLKSMYLTSALRRCRKAYLRRSFEFWNARYCAAQRVQRPRLRNLHRYMARRISRSGFDTWVTMTVRQAKLRRFGMLFCRVPREIGFCTWRVFTDKMKTATAMNRENDLRRALVRQRNDCEKLMERRSLECAQRTAAALLHSWRCAVAVEASASAQQRTTARALATILVALVRARQRCSFARWCGAAHADRTRESADAALATCEHTQRLDRVRQGSLLLKSVVNHRRRLALSRALNGTWRTARWQTTVRAIDSSSTREQRRLRAECDALRARISEIERDAQHCREMEAQEADRNVEAHEEVESIMEAVWRERLQQEAAVQKLEMNLQRSEDKEAIAMERVREAEANRTHEASDLERELREARARNAILEDNRRDIGRELTAVRSELHQAVVAADQHGREGRRLEKLSDEQAHSFDERARSLENRLQKAEQDASMHALQMECDAQERVRIANVEMEERSRHAEKEINRIVAERDRISEMQAAMADEQDRTIRRLEELLKEQGDQLHRERRDHSKGLEQLKSSASLTHSRSHLFEEQVAALRQQLHHKNSEIQASERAWASDRAALLAAVASCATSGQPSRPRTAAPRRSKSPTHTSQRSSRVAERSLMSSQSVKARVGFGGSMGACPWHGNRPPATLGLAPT